MKKFRFVIPAIAFMLAIGAAFASAALPPQIGYVKVSNPLQPCQQRNVDCTGGTATCLDAGQIVFDGSIMNATSCGAELKRNP